VQSPPFIPIPLFALITQLCMLAQMHACTSGLASSSLAKIS
jgi:hypothetical protein